jgi:hypothetical protein
LHRLGGIAAIVVAKVVLIGLGVGLGVRALCARLARPLWLPAAATVVGMLYPARHLMLARPTVFTLVAITLMLLIVQRVRREGRLRWALLLIPVQVFWANVQGLYLLGPVLLACFVVGDAVAALFAPRVPSLQPAPPRRVRWAWPRCCRCWCWRLRPRPMGCRGYACPSCCSTVSTQSRQPGFFPAGQRERGPLVA